MERFINRPKIIDEAAAVSKNKKTGKAGQHVILEILMGIALFFFVVIGESIADFTLLYIAQSNAVADAAGNLWFLGFSESNYTTMINLAVTIVCTVLVLLFAKFLQKRKLNTVGFTKKNAVPHYLIGLLLGIVTFALSIAVCAMFGTITISLAPSINIVPLIIIFLGYMIQGNSEEVLCRGQILVSTSRRYPVWVGVIVNSVIFAAMHLFNPGMKVLPFINIALFGVLMSLIFIKTGNIWMVSGLHTAWNFVQGNVFGVLVSGGASGETILNTVSHESGALINGGDFGLEGGLAVTIILAIFIAIFFFIKPCKGVNGEKVAETVEVKA
ncbi:MAG: CPBP family intramembrane metalloprotease [Clostridiales bacterium]|nr:CPBP family intramembrane metalloprotease [Clostridiales bacterium]